MALYDSGDVLITSPSLGGHITVHIDLDDYQPPIDGVRFAVLACEREAGETFDGDVGDVRALMEIEINAAEISLIGASCSTPTHDVDKVVHLLGRQFGIGTVTIIGHPMYRRIRAPWAPE